MKFLLAMMVLFSLSAFAKEGGNGGDVIVCRDANSEIKSVELLDYYEARAMRQFKIQEYPNMTDEQFITAIGNKINSMEDFVIPFNTKEALELMGAVRNFIKTGQSSVKGILFTNEVLSDISDSEELFIPRGCYVEQIAIWQYPSFPEDPRFIMQADLLKRLSDRDLRGLVLHEMIYKTLYTRSFGDLLKDSYSPRYLHEKLMSRDLKEFMFKDYFQFIQGLYWRQGTAEGKAYLKKGKYYLEIYKAIPQTDGTFEMQIIDTDVTITLNKEGKIDRAATFKSGSIRVSPFYQLMLNNYDPGMLFVTFAEIPFIDPNMRHFIGMRFGENVMKVKLNPYSGNGPLANWGLTFKSADFKTKNVTVSATPSPMAQTITKKFYVDFTENFDVVIKELPAPSNY